MGFLPKARRVLRIRSGTAAVAAARDVDEEVRFHLESRTRELMEREGLTRPEAEGLARREFGGTEAERVLRRETHRLQRRRRVAETADRVWHDAALAVRRLRRQPGFTALASITLAIGIGATTAMFSVVHGVLLEPLPFAEPDRLVALWHTGSGPGRDVMHQSTGTYLTYREENRVFEEVGLWDNVQVTVTGLAEPERVDGMLVTQPTLPLLGVRPAAGRLFTAEDDAHGSAATVVLSYGYWQRSFGGDPDVVGRTLTVNGNAIEIIGVLPRDFRFPTIGADLFFPFRLDRAAARVGRFNYQVLARLRPGVTIAEAHADLERMIPLTVEKFPDGWDLAKLRRLGLAPVVRTLKADVIGEVSRTLWLVFGAVGIVLLIACANVANLLLVRARARRREVAIRAALGAGRPGVAREFLLEGLALGLLGGSLGTGLAVVGLDLLRVLAPDTVPRLDQIGLDPLVLLFAGGISVFSVVVFALLPVLEYSRPDLATAFREHSPASTIRGGRSRDALAVTQVALALLLLVGSGLMIRSFEALRAVDPGFEGPAEVLTFRLFIPTAEVPDEREAARLHQEIVARIRAIPGVVAASMTNSVPMDGRNNNNSIFVEGFPVPVGEAAPSRRLKFVAPGYFETLQNPLLAGRTFEWADVHDVRTVAVVTENFAREYWDVPAAAVGGRIREGPNASWKEIVGVVGDVHDDGVDRDATAVLYWPFLVADFWGMEFFGYFSRSTVYAVRTTGNPTERLPAIRRAVWSVNPNLPLANIQTLEDLLDRSTARTSFTLTLLTIAAAVALILGVVGLYGVISYNVSARFREIGIRMAIGAERLDVTRMVLIQGLRLAGFGIFLGLIIALAFTRAMRSLLFEVEPVDPATYAFTAALLVTVAAAASYLPARRAAGVDPVQVLRHE